MATLPHPLMFQIAALNYIGSCNALKHWSAESPFWKSATAVNQNHAQNLEKAVEKEARDRFYRWMEGIERYAKFPLSPRPALSGQPLWSQGAATLYSYQSATRPHPSAALPLSPSGRGAGGEGEGEPVLVIPSLINRSYILDMDPKNSLMRFLGRSAAAHLLDWGEPEAETEQLTMSDYIVSRLEPAIDLLFAKYKKPVHLVGYCMGGLLAMAATHRQPHKIGKLALLATPWDFHAKGMQRPPAMLPKTDWAGILPPQLIHNWFYLQKPWSVHEKFARFGTYEANSPRLKEFVAIEQWLQDGVGMSARAAQECFINWASENHTATGQWRVQGEPVLPQHINKPTFIAIPERDGIVTPASTAPLIDFWPHAHTHRIPAGHITMIAGLKARQNLWNPLAKWLNSDL